MWSKIIIIPRARTGLTWNLPMLACIPFAFLAFPATAQVEWKSQQLASTNWLCSNVQDLLPFSLADIGEVLRWGWTPDHPPAPRNFYTELADYRECIKWMRKKSVMGVGRMESTLAEAEHAFAEFAKELRANPEKHFHPKAWVPKKNSRATKPIDCRIFFNSLKRYVVLSNEPCNQIRKAVTAYVTLLGLTVRMAQFSGPLERSSHRCGKNSRAQVDAILTATVSLGYVIRTIRRKNIVEFDLDEIRWTFQRPEDRRPQLADAFRVTVEALKDAETLATSLRDSAQKAEFAYWYSSYKSAQMALADAIDEGKWARLSPGQKAAERAMAFSNVVFNKIWRYSLQITESTIQTAFSCLKGKG